LFLFLRRRVARHTAALEANAACRGGYHHGGLLQTAALQTSSRATSAGRRLAGFWAGVGLRQVPERVPPALYVSVAEPSAVA